jgi:predicted RNA-binding protein
MSEVGPEVTSLVKAGSWWISLAYSIRRIESVENAEALLLRVRTIHLKVAMIALNLARYASARARMVEGERTPAA